LEILDNTLIHSEKPATRLIEAIKPKSLGAQWTHVLYTGDQVGQARVFINGKLNVQQAVGSDVSNWMLSPPRAAGRDVQSVDAIRV
jgi:hypothetical protein